MMAFSDALPHEAARGGSIVTYFRFLVNLLLPLSFDYKLPVSFV